MLFQKPIQKQYISILLLHDSASNAKFGGRVPFLWILIHPSLTLTHSIPSNSVPSCLIKSHRLRIPSHPIVSIPLHHIHSCPITSSHPIPLCPVVVLLCLLLLLLCVILILCLFLLLLHLCILLFCFAR